MWMTLKKLWHYFVWRYWSTYTPSNPLFRLFLGLWRVVIDPCFVDSNKTEQTIVLITAFEIVIRLHLWSSMSNRRSHLADSFFMFKYSCKIWCIHFSCDTNNMSQFVHFHFSIIRYHFMDCIDYFGVTSADTSTTKLCKLCLDHWNLKCRIAVVFP